MQDQADELRQLARRGTVHVPRQAPRWITVSGGKGGVGATTIALGLARSLALAGRRTLLLDGDSSSPDLASIVGIDPRYTIGDVLASRRSIHEALVAGPAGIQLLLGPSLDQRALEYSCIALERLIEPLQNFGPHADVVVADAGSGVNRTMRRFWQAADDLVLVTTTDPVAIVDTYAALKQLYTREPNQAVHVVVNNGDDPLESTAVGDRLGEACRRFLALSPATTTCVPPDPEWNRTLRGSPALEPEARRTTAADVCDAWVESWIAARGAQQPLRRSESLPAGSFAHFTTLAQSQCPS